MKGYARVDVSDAIQARKNFLQWFVDIEAILEEYYQKFYDEWFPKQNFISKYFNRNMSTRSFFYMNGFEEIVYDKMPAPKNILNDLEIYYWCRWEVEQKSKAIESLYKATKDDYILVDQTLAAHINKWKNYKIGENNGSV